MAAAGLTVAKHGNRAVSSGCGSADVLEAFGVKIDAPPGDRRGVRPADRHRFSLRAQAPWGHEVCYRAPPRNRAFGPFSICWGRSPIRPGATAQLIGVYDPKLTEMFAGVLKNLGTKRAFVVHGADGLDEATVTGETRVSELKDGTDHDLQHRPRRLLRKDIRRRGAPRRRCLDKRRDHQGHSHRRGRGAAQGGRPECGPGDRRRREGADDPRGHRGGRGMHRQRRRHEEAPGPDRDEPELIKQGKG